MTRQELKELRQKRRNAAFLISLLVGALLVAMGLLFCAFANTYTWWYLVAGIVSGLIAVIIANRYRYLLED